MASKNVADYRELLRAGRWFRALPDAFQDAIISISVLRRVPERGRLFARGDATNGMFGSSRREDSSDLRTGASRSST
jgi:hypothetical protein